MCDLAAQRERLEPALSEAIRRVLDHGQFVLGPEVSELESKLAERAHVAHAVSCANGTDAIQLCLMAERIGPGDAVVCPAFTFVATAEAIATVGATPVFADVDPRTFNIDPASTRRSLEVAVRQGLVPRAIIAVDLFGLPADYAILESIAKESGLVLIADAAQSFGAASPLGPVGSLAHYTTTSFFPSKPLGCYGDGGAIFTASPQNAELLTSLRFHGKGDDRYDNVRIGLNSRLDSIQAAVLLTKLSIFDDELVLRSQVASRYSQELGDVVQAPVVPGGHVSAWAQYTVICRDSAQRARIQDACSADGISTTVYYPKPLHHQIGYSRFPGDPAGLANSEELSTRVLSVPMHPYLHDFEQERIAQVIAQAGL